MKNASNIISLEKLLVKFEIFCRRSKFGIHIWWWTGGKEIEGRGCVCDSIRFSILFCEHGGRSETSHHLQHWPFYKFGIRYLPCTCIYHNFTSFTILSFCFCAILWLSFYTLQFSLAMQSFYIGGGANSHSLFSEFGPAIFETAFNVSWYSHEFHWHAGPCICFFTLVQSEIILHKSYHLLYMIHMWLNMVLKNISSHCKCMTVIKKLYDYLITN